MKSEAKTHRMGGMDIVTITIDFELTITSDNTAARLLISESLDEVITEAILCGAIDSGNAEILSHHVIIED